ncbi:mechanosensitive ion channel family protein [Caulobacter segnis]
MEQLKTWFADAALLLGWAPPWLVSAPADRPGRRRRRRERPRRRRPGRAAYDLPPSPARFWQPLIARTRRPTRLAFIVAALGPAVAAAPLTAGQAAGRRARVPIVLFILLLGWMAMTALDIGAALYLRGFQGRRRGQPAGPQARDPGADPAPSRGDPGRDLHLGPRPDDHPGRAAMGRQLAGLAGGAAGVASSGLALQPLLTNLIAGIQIAITQPIRIDDAVIVEKEWGNIEEINATYVVVRLWDWRRMVLPLSYFIRDAVPELDTREAPP